MCHQTLRLPTLACKCLSFFAPNEAVIEMIMRGRSSNLRHVSSNHRVNLDWLFDRVNVDSFCEHQKQFPDILMKGSFTTSQRNDLMQLVHVTPTQLHIASVRSISQLFASSATQKSFPPDFFRRCRRSGMSAGAMRGVRQARQQEGQSRSVSQSNAGSTFVESSPSQHDAGSNPLRETGGECSVSTNETMIRSHWQFITHSGERWKKGSLRDYDH